MRALKWVVLFEESYLVRENQRQLQLVRDGLSITAALERNAEGRGTSPEGSASETERAHGAMGWIESGGDSIPLEPGLKCKGRSRMPVVP